MTRHNSLFTNWLDSLRTRTTRTKRRFPRRGSRLRTLTNREILTGSNWRFASLVSAESLEDRLLLSHFRGGSITHDVNSSGLVTLDSFSVWRDTSFQTPTYSLYTGPSQTGTNLSNFSVTNEVTFATGTELGGGNFTVRRATLTDTLPDAGTYYATWRSNAKVGGGNNFNQTNWELETKIVWAGPGTTSASPTQREATIDIVARGNAYSQNLNSVDPDGTPLNYQFIVGDQDPNYGPTTAIPGIDLDSFGNVSLSAAETAALSLGRYEYKTRVTDGSGAYSDRDVVVVVQDPGPSGGAPNANAPVLAPIGSQIVALGQTLNFTASATDADGDSLTVRAQGLPTGSTLPETTNAGGSVSSTFSWKPVAGDEGIYTINVEAFDNVTIPIIDNEQVQITVTGSNAAPVLTPIGNKTVANNGTVNFTVGGSDADGDNLTFSANFLPTGATFNPSTRVFNWTPTSNQFDNLFTGIVFRVTDDGVPNLFDEEAISITVGAGNQPPVFTPIADQTVAAGQAVSFNVMATDAAGQTIDLTPVSIPAGATFNSASGTGSVSSTFNWTPTAAQAGANSLRFKAQDNGLPSASSFLDLTITVTTGPANQTPTDITLAPAAVDENSAAATVVGTITVTDPDAGDTHTLSFVAPNNDAGGLFEIVGNQLRVKTAGLNHETSPTQTVTIRANDGSANFDKDITITINDVNDAPVFTSTATPSVAENTTAVVTVVATDEDDPAQTLSFGITGGADSALFSINGSGELSFNSAPDFESPADVAGAAAGDNVYEVEVTATDNGTDNLSTIQYLQVTVTDVAETIVSIDGMGNLVITDIGGLNDAVTIQADTANSEFVISHATELVGSLIAGVMGGGSTVRVPFGDIAGGQIIANLDGGDDSLTVDYSSGATFGKTITFNGGESAETNGDTLFIRGDSGTTVVSGIYSPDATTFGNGQHQLTFSGGGTETINFTELEPTEVSAIPSYTLTTPGSADSLTLSDGTAMGGQQALVVTGSSDGVMIESLTLFDVTTFTLDTATNDSTGGGNGNDTLTVAGGLDDGLNLAQNLVNLAINTGMGSEGDTDQVTINGEIDVPGSVTIDQAETVDANADITAGTSLTISNVGTEIDLAANVDLTAENGNLSLNSSVAQIDLSGASGTNRLVADSSGDGNVTTAPIVDSGTPAGLVIDADNAVTTSSINVQSTITIRANQDMAGSEGFTQSGDIATTNDTASAVDVTVNLMAGGTGNYSAGSVQTGTTAGRISLSVNGGDIVDGNSGTTNFTANSLLIRSDEAGTSADPLESTVSNLEGATGNLVLNNTGSLTIGGVDALTMGLSGSVVDISSTGSITVSENLTGTGNVELTATDAATGTQNLTVQANSTVSSTSGTVTLQAGDSLFLQDSSTVSATTVQPGNVPGVTIEGDFGNADAGTGATIDLQGTINSSGVAIIRGEADADTINVNPGTTHSATDLSLDGQGSGDTYTIQFGRLATGNASVGIKDSGTTGSDAATITGLDPAETIRAQNNDANGVDPQTGGYVENTTENERVSYTQTLETLTIQGGLGNDTLDVQPSQTATITVDGDGPVFGDPSVPPGDTLDFDSLDNTFSINGKTIFTDGGSPNAFLGVTFRDIENFPLTPIGPSPAIAFDFDSDNTDGSPTPSPTQTGYNRVLANTLHATSGLGYGWQQEVSELERGDGFYSGPQANLLRDTNRSNSAATFTVDLINGWYSVLATVGDPFTDLTGVSIRNADTGGTLATGITSKAGVSTQASFAVQVTDGSLDLQFLPSDTHPGIFAVNGLSIRPANLLTMGLNLSAVGNLSADGVTTDTFRLADGPANTYVTVSVNDGLTLLNTDADSEVTGIQVITDANGEADILIRRASGMTTGFVSFVDVAGQGLGCSVLDYVLPNSRNFDFNSTHTTGSPVESPTQTPVAAAATPDGFIGVPPTTLFATETGYGWLSSPAHIDNGAMADPLGDLKRDLAKDTVNRTFRVALPNGSYQGTATFGDRFDHDGIGLSVNGAAVVSGLSHTANEYVQRTFDFTVTGGQADFTFSDSGTIPNWVVNGLQIRLNSAVSSFTFANIGSVPADGLTTSTVTATTTLAAGTQVTVASSLGTISTADVNSTVDGVQVTVSATNQISFDVLAPTSPGTPTISATSLDGSHHTETTSAALLSYGLSNARRFDFNHTHNTSSHTPSPTAAGFVGVLRTDVTTSDGHGWLASPNSNDAGLTYPYSVTTTDLYRDVHTGHTSLGSRTFRIQVAAATMYDGTVYLGWQRNDTSTRVTIEGVATPLTADLKAAAFTASAFTGASDVGGDGFLDVTFESTGNISPFWASPGLDLFETTAPIVPAALHATESGTGEGVNTLTTAELAPLVQIAVGAWQDQVLTDAERQLLESTSIVIRDLGTALGLTTTGRQIVIDDDGAGLGWHTSTDAPQAGYDLLTVLAHEFGHILGHEHDHSHSHESDDLMSPVLTPGTRHDRVEGIDGFFSEALRRDLPFED